MGKKKVYRFRNHCQGKKRAERAGFPVTVSALATVLARRSGRSSALPYAKRPLERRDSTTPACFCRWSVFRCENGRFFDVNFYPPNCFSGRFFAIKVVGFSIDKNNGDVQLSWCLYNQRKSMHPNNVFLFHNL